METYYELRYFYASFWFGLFHDQSEYKAVLPPKAAFWMRKKE
jgi:hypothetical protein